MRARVAYATDALYRALSTCSLMPSERSRMHASIRATFSLPRSSSDSNSGGLTIDPVTATRTDWKTTFGLSSTLLGHLAQCGLDRLRRRTLDRRESAPRPQRATRPRTFLGEHLRLGLLVDLDVVGEQEAHRRDDLVEALDSLRHEGRELETTRGARCRFLGCEQSRLIEHRESIRSTKLRGRHLADVDAVHPLELLRIPDARVLRDTRSRSNLLDERVPVEDVVLSSSDQPSSAR